MPNNRFNKQVTPKGYQKGGKVKKDYKLGTKFQGDYKGKSVPGKVKEFFKTGVKQTVGTAKEIGKKFRAKKMGGGMMMERPMMKKGGPSKKPKIRKIGVIGVGKAKDYPGIKEIIKMNKQGKKRFGMKMGGALKPVDPKTQKGLSKLPTKVRNKMGYMKKGGKVHGK